MSTLLAPEPTTTGTDDGPELTHVVHSCDENTALCGLDVTGDPIVDLANSEDVCVVCNDLCINAGGLCPRCGKAGW